MSAFPFDFQLHGSFILIGLDLAKTGSQTLWISLFSFTVYDHHLSFMINWVLLILCGNENIVVVEVPIFFPILMVINDEWLLRGHFVIHESALVHMCLLSCVKYGILYHIFCFHE